MIPCRRSSYFGADLAVAMNARATALGYRSVSGYLTGLVRVDFLTGADHQAALKIASLSPVARDQIDAAIRISTMDEPASFNPYHGALCGSEVRQVAAVVASLDPARA